MKGKCKLQLGVGAYLGVGASLSVSPEKRIFFFSTRNQVGIDVEVGGALKTASKGVDVSVAFALCSSSLKKEKTLDCCERSEERCGGDEERSRIHFQERSERREKRRQLRQKPVQTNLKCLDAMNEFE